jgi:hypothetical protein
MKQTTGLRAFVRNECANYSNGKLVDAPQLTEIAPQILHSKGCLEAV